MRERRHRRPKSGYSKRGPYLMPPVKERLEKFIKRTKGCWCWVGATDKRGYGRFHLDERSVPAYRAVYEAHIKKVPKGLELDHLCRNPNCVNPAHLEPVTHSENYRRGNSGKHLGAIHRAKTHCPYGHPYNKKNTAYQYNKNGSKQRVCKTCQRRWWKTARENKRNKNK